MTLTLDLSPELESRLQQEAERLGVPPEAYVARIVEASLSQRTVGEQIVAEWERAGVIGSRPEIPDSQAHARKLRERAQTRDHS